MRLDTSDRVAGEIGKWVTRRIVLTTIGLLLAMAFSTQAGHGQETNNPETEVELSPEEEREQLMAQRFLQVLLRRPNTGTSLDRVFGYHIGRGTLSELLESLSETAKAAEDPGEGGRHWMVVGLLQLQRGEDAAAIMALERAEQRLADNPLAAFFHGQALLLVGRNKEAAEAMQRALDRKPPRQEFLKIAGQLGRLYQRDGRTDDALSIWEQLEESFPGDDGVRQRIARVMMEEGDTAGALERYDSLAKNARTPNDQIVFALKAAELRIRGGARKDAIAALESLLKKLRPGSYLHDEARRRIESAFLENADYAGLADYYEKWVEKNPEDVNAMIRLARTLSIQGRAPESITWFEKAIELAPSDSQPRVSLINAYVAQQKHSDAAKQYEALVELDPGNPDHLVRWGQLLLEDQSIAKEKRSEAAAEIWMRLAASRSDDAVIQSQVADLLRGAKLEEQAIERYRNAIDLSPDAPQYKEYLGEYLHQLDRKEEAFEVWHSLAAGDLRTRANLVRLAEVLHQFERSDEGLKAMAEACEMDPTIEERLRYAKWLRDAEKFDASLEQIQLASEVTESLDERERVFAAEVETYQTSGRLEERIQLATTDAESSEGDGESWRRLAVLYNANGQTRDAIVAIEKALELAPKSIEALVVAAQMYEDSGRLQFATEKRVQLAETDQRFKAGHLQKLASLHLRMGETDRAIAAGKQLLAASNGTIDAYRFYANLCGQIGRLDERLDTLRRCARANPRNEEAQRMLATQLAADFKTEQAIELYWKMFDGAREIDDRRRVVIQLADLYLRTNRLDQLIARLEIRGRESGDRRATVDLVATAHEQVGDLGLARQALDGLLQEGGRDTMLIERLVNLAEQTGEYEEAVRLQRQLLRLSPDRKNESRLAGLLIEIGDLEEAQSMWMRLAETNSNPAELGRNLDRLFGSGETKTAIELARRVVERDPSDWETLFKLLLLYASENDWDAADKAGQQLVKLDLKDSTLPAGKQQTTRTVYSVGAMNGQPGVIKYARLENLYEFYQLFDERYGYSSTTRLMSPMDYGHAKVIATYCRLKRLLDDGKPEELKKLVENAEKVATAEKATSDEIWHWFQLATLASSMGQQSATEFRNPKTWTVLKRLVEVDEPLALMPLVQLMSNRQAYAQRDDIVLEPMDDDWLKWVEEKASKAGKPQPSQGMRWDWGQFYAAELWIRGDKEKAEQYSKQLLANALKEDADPQTLAASIQQAVARQSDDDLWALVERALKEPASGKNYNYAFRPEYLLNQFSASKRVTDGLSKGPEDKTYRERILELADRVMKNEATSSSTRRAVQLTGVGGPRNTYQLIGTSYQQINIEFPPKGLGPNDQVVQTQHTVWKQLGEYSGEWIDSLEKEVGSSEQDSRLKIWALIQLATLHQWEERTDSAIEKLGEATELAISSFPTMEPELRLMTADLLLRQNRKREALEAIDALSVYDQRTMALREFASARLAAQIGDAERATLAARRLFGVRLNAGAQIELAKLMRKLGMHQLASDLVRRMQNRGGRTTDQMQALMTYFIAQGEKEQAAEVAMALLRRSAPKRRRSSNYQTADDTRRRNALQTLANAGRLTPLIKATEERLKNAPKSQRIRSELSEMYLAAGQSAKSAEVLGATDLKDVNGVRALQATAEQFVKVGKMDEACDAYLKLLRRKQDSFNQQFYDIKRPFDERGRLGDLADLMLDVGLNKFTDHRVSEICEGLIREQKNVEAARRLYYGMLKRPSTGINSMYSMSNIMGSARVLLTDEEVVKQTAEFMVNASLNGSTWQTLFSGYSTGSDGRKNNVTTYFVRHVAQNEENVQLVEGMLREKLEEKGDWLEGKVWLGLILTVKEEYEEALELLEPLLDEDTSPKPTHECIWLIGSLIDTHKPMQPLALRLYDYALEHTSSRSTGSDFKYTLEGRVSQFMAEIGEKKRARDMVLKAIETGVSRSSSRADYAAYEKIRSTLSMIEFLAEIDYHADAFKLARNFDRSLFVTAGRYNRGYDARFDAKEEELLREVQKLGGLATARTMIDTSTKKAHAVDLGIGFRERPFTGEGMNSLWVQLVAKSVESEEEAKVLAEFVEELKTLAEERANDDSVLFAHAIASEIAGDVKPLRSLFGKWKEDYRKDVEVVDARLRSRAFLYVVLTLHRSTAGEDPQKNRQMARWIDVGEIEAINPLEQTYFYAQIGKQADDEKRLKSAWRRAIEIKGNQWLLFDLSQAAAERGLKPISTDAFAAAIAAPQGQVKEVTSQASAGSLGQLLSSAQSTPSRSSSNRGNDLDPEMVRLAKRVYELDAAWRKAEIYTQPVYEPLVALILGTGGSPRAFCTPVEVKNNRMQIDSVFDRLAKRAHWSKKTDDLVSRLKADSVASHLMAAIALLRGERGEEAVKRFEAIDPTLLRSVPKELALQSLLLGLEDTHCRAAAFRLGLALVDQNRPTGRYEAVQPFDRFALELAKRGLANNFEETLVGKAITDYLELSAHENDRYSGSSRYTRRLPQLEEIARMLLPKGRTVEAMNYLAMRQEVFDQGFDRGNDWVGSWALQSFRGMPDHEQAYKQLAEVTFQGDGALVNIRAMARRQRLPDWIPSSVGGGYPPFPAVVDPALPVVTSYSLLAQLAKDSGQEEDLFKRLELARAKERAGAMTASAITHLVLEKPIDPNWLAAVESALDSIQPGEGKAKSAAPLAELQLASMVAAESTHEDFANKVTSALLAHGNSQGRAYLNAWVAGYRHKMGWAETSTLRSADELAHWERSTLASAKEFFEGKTPPVWVADGAGGVQHVCGFSRDYLWFKYPLRGNFSIEWETSDGNWSEADMVFNDLRITPIGTGNYLYLKTQSSSRWGRLYSKSLKKDWNHCKYELDDQWLSFFINGTLIYREKRTEDAPWFAVHSEGSKSTNTRGIKIEGNPEIPRQLELIPTEGLRGWSGQYFGAALPTFDFSKEHREKAAAKPRLYLSARSRKAIDNLSWTVNESGELISGKADQGFQQQNCIHYQRPLGEGDTLRYEFFYEEGKTEVHPTVGRIAYVLRPDGLKVHWMNAPSTSWTIPAGYEVPLPESESKPLPLKQSQWNQVELTRTGAKLQMKLNGVVVFDREPQSRLGDMVFGFFHYRDKSKARLRNIVLSGDWPEQLPADLFEFDAKSESE